MASTGFVDRLTPIMASWLNDVNTIVYTGAINVKMAPYSATGNGTTDDTVALQAALTAGTGKTVYIPAGTYKLTASLSVPANTYVYSTDGSCILTQTLAGQHALVLSGDGVTIDGLHLTGINSLTNTASGIRADGRNYPTIIKCVINSFAWGVQLRGCTNARIEGNRFINGSYDASTSSDILLYGDATTPGRRA